MYHVNNEKPKTIFHWRNRTTKLRKDQNSRRKGNLQILGNFGSGHHQTNGDERKNEKEQLRRTRKLLDTKLHNWNLIKGINTWAVPPSQIFGKISEVDESGTNEQENSWQCIKPYITEMMLTDLVKKRREKRTRRHWSSVSMHRYNNRRAH